MKDFKLTLQNHTLNKIMKKMDNGAKIKLKNVENKCYNKFLFKIHQKILVLLILNNIFPHVKLISLQYQYNNKMKF